MHLNFVKLFPQSCKMQGIDNMSVDVTDIKFFKRSLVKQIGFTNEEILVDQIQLGNHTTLTFPPLDNGIAVLTAIYAALNIINGFGENAHSMEILSEDFKSIHIANAKKQLAEYTLKYS